MRREIKFRAWDGSKIIYPDSDGWFNNCKFANEPIFQMCRLDTVLKRLKVMQYTGLKDKSGKEIFEGDIVEVRNVGLCEVVFENGAFFIFKKPSFNGLLYQYTLDGAVVGNIYRNPELLGGKNE